MQQQKLIAILIGSVISAIIFLSLAKSIYHVVPPGHRGVSVTLGKVSPTFRNEGFSLKKPFIEDVFDIAIKQQTASGQANCFSADLQNIGVQYSVLYRTPENKIVTLFQNYAGDPLISLINPRLFESLKQVTAIHRAEELVKNRDQVKAAVLENMRKAMGDLIYIEDITINDVTLSVDLEKAIEQKTVREQEALSKSFELIKAQKQAEITKVEAQAEAAAVAIKGQALKTSPEVIQLEIAKKWNGVSPTTVVTDGRSATSVILPLK